MTLKNHPNYYKLRMGILYPFLNTNSKVSSFEQIFHKSMDAEFNNGGTF
jgi:hypothetical protein